MISFTKCKKVLNKNGKNYTDEEVEIIRVVLYNLVEIIHNDLTKNENTGVRNWSEEKY